MNKLANTLCKAYGPVVNADQLSKMSEFQERVSNFDDIKVPSVFLSWDHVLATMSSREIPLPQSLEYAAKKSLEVSQF